MELFLSFLFVFFIVYSFNYLFCRNSVDTLNFHEIVESAAVATLAGTFISDFIVYIETLV